MTLIFDTETNGKANFNAPPEHESQPRLVQLAALLLGSELETVAELNVIIKPVDFVISDEVAAIHGIKQAYAEKHGIPEKQALEMFRTFAEMSATIVAHNIKFDGIVLGRANHIHGLSYKIPVPYCTMNSSTNICKLPGGYGGGYKWPNLQEAHQILLGTGFDDAHDAMADVKACARVYEFLIHGKRAKAPTPEPASTKPPIENLPDVREYDDMTLMPFGKYKGTPLGKLPESYCNWLYEQENLSDRLLYKWLHGGGETCVDNL